MRPGKKGISLVAEQFDALLAAAPAVSSALERQDLAFSAPLSVKCALHFRTCCQPCAKLLLITSGLVQDWNWLSDWHVSRAQESQRPSKQ